MANLGLWKTSGHFDFYKENMFQAMEVENEEYQIKPMNCPFHCLIYKVRTDVSQVIAGDALYHSFPSLSPVAVVSMQPAVSLSIPHPHCCDVMRCDAM